VVVAAARITHTEPLTQLAELARLAWGAATEGSCVKPSKQPRKAACSNRGIENRVHRRSREDFSITVAPATHLDRCGSTPKRGCADLRESVRTASRPTRCGSPRTKKLSYGLAPGFALYAMVGGRSGALAGVLFAGFVIARLTFFTLSKAESDPAFFRGAPSTIGGVVTLTALIVFERELLLVGLCVGLACALMVSFDTLHRHLGRALVLPAARARLLALSALMLATGWIGGWRAGVLLLLVAALAYALWPTGRALLRVSAAKHRASRHPDAR
jgi:hypothetical protein